MRRTGNLFIKMFLGFWGASIAILATWMIAAHYFEALPRVEPEHGRRGGPNKFMLQLHYSLQNLPLPELADFLSGYERRHGLEVWLLDAEGSDLLDRPVPAGAARLAEKLQGPRKRVTGRGARGPRDDRAVPVKTAAGLNEFVVTRYYELHPLPGAGLGTCGYIRQDPASKRRGIHWPDLRAMTGAGARTP